MNQLLFSRRKPGGFTLLELIVVITIIGILASVVVVKTSGFAPRARRTAVDADIGNILQVAESIYAETGRYPQTIDDMINAVDANGVPLSASLEEYPKDPWGGEYTYELLDNRPSVTCLGADNELGGEGEDEDIIRPESTEEF